MKTLALLLLAACAPSSSPSSSSPSTTTPTSSPRAALSNVATRKPLPCPPPRAEQMEYESAPPWERDPLGRWPNCIETDDGARVTLEKDTTDRDGWRVTLVVEDGTGTRVRTPTRAQASFALAPDGGVVIAHVEDEVSVFSPTGELRWKRKHPYCGSAHVSVGHDGRVVLGCGYSYVAYALDGSIAWQKWPLGNETVGPPLLAKDGTMIVRAGKTIAKLDTAGDVVWKVDTGGNRYVMPIGVATNGHLLFRTVMAEMHTPGDIHIYYETEPDELFEVTLDGKIASRTPLTGKPAWPSSLPWTPALRSGRLP